MNEVSKDEIVEGLKKGGIQKGDILFLHTSLKSFGTKIEGGPNGLIEGILTAVSPGGTLAAPTHSHPLENEPFNPDTAEMYPLGALPRVLMKRDDAQRSFHPSHSDAAVGAQKKWLLEGHPESGTVGEGSPLDKLRKHPQGKVVLFGVDFTTMTLIHLAEFLAGVPYIGKAWGGAYPTQAPVIKNGKTIMVDLSDLCGVSEGFNVVEKPLVKAGVITETKIRDCRVRILPAGKTVDVLVPILKENPRFLIPEESDTDYCKNALEILGGEKKLSPQT